MDAEMERAIALSLEEARRHGAQRPVPAASPPPGAPSRCFTYCCDGEDDRGWGCTHRVVQTLVLHMLGQQVSLRDVTDALSVAPGTWLEPHDAWRFLSARWPAGGRGELRALNSVAADGPRRRGFAGQGALNSPVARGRQRPPVPPPQSTPPTAAHGGATPVTDTGGLSPTGDSESCDDPRGGGAAAGGALAPARLTEELMALNVAEARREESRRLLGKDPARAGAGGAAAAAGGEAEYPAAPDGLELLASHLGAAPAAGRAAVIDDGTYSYAALCVCPAEGVLVVDPHDWGDEAPHVPLRWVRADAFRSKRWLALLLSVAQ